jgi:hypothetical protein
MPSPRPVYSGTFNGYFDLDNLRPKSKKNLLTVFAMFKAMTSWEGPVAMFYFEADLESYDIYATAEGSLYDSGSMEAGTAFLSRDCK